MDLNELQINHHDKESDKTKSMLLVVGKGGHGKSSFCKMIVNQGQNISQSMSQQSQRCQVYISDKFDDIFGGQIEVIDTPSINSRNQAYSTAEEVDQLILIRKGQIIGVAIIVDAHKMEQCQQEGENSLLLFLQLLRMKHADKSNLFFCVLSKFDLYYDDQEANKAVFEQLKILYDKNSLLNAWYRKIKWISEPNQSKKQLDESINGQLQHLLSNQFYELRVNLTQNQKLCLSFEKYLEDRIYFEIALRSVFLSEYKYFDYRKETKQLETTVKAEQQHLTTMQYSITAGLLTFFVSQLKAASHIASFALTGCSFGLTYLFCKKFNKEQLIYIEEPAERQKVALLKIEDIEHAWIEQLIKKNIHIHGTTLYCQNVPFITSIQCLNVRRQNICDLQNKGTNIALPLKSQTVFLQINYKLPQIQYNRAFLKKVTKRCYGTKQ